MRLKRNFRTFGLATIALGCALAVAQAQQLDPAAKPDRGITQSGSFEFSDIENVNLTNGNVNISIPLASLPPIAGGKLTWSIRAVYNSKLWDMKSFNMQPDSNHSQPWEYYVNQRSDDGGWLVAAGYAIEQLFAEYDAEVDCGNPSDPSYGQCQAAFAYRYKMVLHTPDGSNHELRSPEGDVYTGIGNQTWRRGFYQNTPYNTGQAMRYYSYDGSFLWAVIYPSGGPVGWEVYMPDGSRVTQFGAQSNYAQQISDTNGNRIEITRTANLAGDVTTTCTDAQTGRQISYTHIAANDTGLVQYKTVGGISQSITVNFTTKTLTGKAVNAGDRSCGNWGTLLGEDFKVITSIVLPETEPNIPRQIGFEYNSDTIDTISPPMEFRSYCGEPVQYISAASRGFGELSRMTLPSGASAEYVYKRDGVQLSGNRFACRLVSGNSLQQKKLIHDGVSSDTWNYTLSNVSGQVTGPDGLLVREQFFQKDSEYGGSTGGTTGFEGLVYRTTRSKASNNQQVLIEERRWEMKKFDTAVDDAPNGRVAFNPLVTAEFTTLCNDSGSPSQMSAKKFQLDFNGNRTNISEYDFFNPGSVTRDTNGVPLDVPSGTVPVRTESTTFYNGAPTGSSPNVYAKRAIGSATPILSAPGLITLGPSQTEFHYDGIDNTPPSRGNLTKERRWEGTRWIETTHTYDPIYGNMIGTRTPSAVDPNGNLTTVVFDPNTHAQPISVTVDPLNGTGQQTGQTTYDFYTGLVLTQTDVNGKVTSFDYTNQLTNAVDPLGRVGVVTGPAVASSFFDSQGNFITLANQQRRVVTRYFDSNAQPDNASQVEVLADLKQQGDGLLKTRATSDQLGRPVKTETSENGGAYSISSQTVYQQMGRITFSSNPTRNTGELTDGWTRTTKDDTGHVIEVASFSGAAQPPSSSINANCTGSVSTSYNAEQTKVTDQAGKKRRSFVDGLGRLKQVDELLETGALYASTTYTYDVLGNLTVVNQGVQQRQFVYDNMSRLRQAYNSEQVNQNGVKIATIYQYDDASNLITRTNPNGTTVGLEYDGLNRAKTKTLSSGGVWVYSYDVGTNYKGRMVSEVLQGSTDGYYYDGYDAAGRITSSRQITTAGAAQSYAMSYKYDLAGSLTSQTYPSNKEYRANYDNAGRVASVSRYNTGVFDKTYVSQFSYSASGAVAAMTFGNNLADKTEFNSRLQPTFIKLGTMGNPTGLLQLGYTYNTSGQANNNGNVLTQTITAPKASGGALVLTQNYTYDALNRLSFAEELIGAASQWNQIYDIDRWSNRAVNSTSTYIPNPGLTPQLLSALDTATNRIRTAVMPGFGYDTSGNLTSQPNEGSGTNIMVYDAENHQTSYTKAGVGPTSYSYDGDGRRVKKTDSNNNTTIFVYNVAGQLTAEYTSETPASGGTSYLTTDHLGSTRVVTKQDGTVKARYDYLPFGEEIGSERGSRALVTGYGASDDTRQKFTQKERDSESGLDYFLARYYSSAQGRFTSIDPGAFTPADPQNWNRYTYCQNNPLKFLDPRGEDLVITGDEADYLVVELSRLTGYRLSRDKKTGRVTIDMRVTRQERGTSTELASLVRTIEGDRSVSVDIEATVEKPGQPSILFDSFARRALDVDDYKAIAAQAPNLATASLGHVLAEYYGAEKKPWRVPETDEGFFMRSHRYGIRHEESIMSGLTGYQERQADLPLPPYRGGPVIKGTISYSSVEYDVVYKTGVGYGLPGKVDRVTKISCLNRCR